MIYQKNTIVEMESSVLFGEDQVLSQFSKMKLCKFDTTGKYGNISIMDIVTTVGKGNGSILLLLDLSASFDTIDHDNLFYTLEKYVGIAVVHYG